MIERNFVSQNMKEYEIERYISQTLKNVGLSHTKMVKTPAGVKIIIYASRPGLVVGKQGANIKELTQAMRTKFKLDNPQIEISEVENQNLDPSIVADKIVSTLERFGTQKFKGIAHKALTDVMNAGALGIEIMISGKVPSARAKTWRFSQGYLKKCGDIAISGVKSAIAAANLKSGTVGVQVKIMPPDLKLPDDITIFDEAQMEAKAAEEKKSEVANEEKKEHKKKEKAEKPKKEKKAAKPKAEKEAPKEAPKQETSQNPQ